VATGRGSRPSGRAHGERRGLDEPARARRPRPAARLQLGVRAYARHRCPDVINQPWFASGVERARHAEELDEAVGGRVAQRTRDEVGEAFEQAQATVAPIYDAHDIVDDPQCRALGTMLMQGPLFRLSENDAVIRFTGRPHGADTDAVLAELGLTSERIAHARRGDSVSPRRCSLGRRR
jgi:crotonobetainyl-CoA:carnitine CoA-transferase CaiB-like acyl-CoA transferase